MCDLNQAQITDEVDNLAVAEGYAPETLKAAQALLTKRMTHADRTWTRGLITREGYVTRDKSP